MKFYTILGLVLIGYTTLAQNNKVEIVWEQEKVFQECRYCGEKSHTSYVVNFKFKETELNKTYHPALKKYRTAAIFKCALDKGEKFSKICDISRTGKHGLEDKVETITHSELVPFEDVKKYTDDYNRKEYEANEETEFNRLFLNCLDSFNYAASLCDKLDTAGVRLMYRKYDELADFASKLDPNGLINIVKDYHIIIPYDANGFGGKDVKLNFMNLQRKILWRLCYINMFDFALEEKNLFDQIIVNTYGDDWKYMFAYNEIFIYLGLGDRKLAKNAVEDYLSLFENISRKARELARIVEDLRVIHSGQNKSNLENLSRYKGFTPAKIELFISSLKLKFPLLFDAYY
jgi:hypothetical protein